MALYSEDKFPNLGNICVICANSVVISSGWEGAEKPVLTPRLQSIQKLIVN